jgi:thiol:disulfide interchange protein DsbG
MIHRRFVLIFAAAALAAMTLPACSDKSSKAPDTPAAKLTPRQAYELAASGSHGFTVGQLMAANTVYVFFDPACPHCAALWASSKPLLTKLKIVWIPIGLLQRSSGPQGATILSAADPVAAMTENETSVIERRGGISVSSSLSDEVLAKVKANTELFAKLGAESVPFIMMKNAKTGEYQTHAGSMQTDELAAMAGV